MNIDFPLHFDDRRRTAATDDEEHIRDLIEQVLFTNAGERVNRPTFGGGLAQLVFAPNSDALAAATQVAVQGALQQWLSQEIVVDSVEVEHFDSTLKVTVKYIVRRSGARRQAEFNQAV
jgi:phage baseplate assembly protein W